MFFFGRKTLIGLASLCFCARGYAQVPLAPIVAHSSLAGISTLAWANYETEEDNLPRDADGFVYEQGTELAQLDLREIAKGDYHLSELSFSQAYHSFTSAYEAGNRTPYLLTQLGIVSHLRGDFLAARQYLQLVAKGITPDRLTKDTLVPYKFGYSSPKVISTARANSARSGISVIFYLLNAQYSGEDYAGYLATSGRFYKQIVENDRLLLTMLAQAYMAKNQYGRALGEINKALVLPAKHPADYREGYRVKGELLSKYLDDKKDGLFYLKKAASMGDEKAKTLLMELNG